MRNYTFDHYLNTEFKLFRLGNNNPKSGAIQKQLHMKTVKRFIYIFCCFFNVTKLQAHAVFILGLFCLLVTNELYYVLT